MKRDLSLIRMILLAIENHSDPARGFRVNVEGYSNVEILYHVKLLRDAGFIVAQDFSSLDVMDYRPKSLTWHGHEFLDATRNDRVWHKVMAHLKDKGIDVPISVIQQLATKYGAAMLGLGE